MVRKIRIFPDYILRERAEDVEKFERLQNLIEDMWETMYTCQGIGLAAPQIGVGKRVFIVDVDKKNLVVVNPRIICKEGEESMEEGCLSLPEVYLPIPRARYIEIEGWDEKGKRIKVKAEGLLARVIQHEFDHLEGVLIIDYAKPSRRVKIEKMLKSLNRRR